MPADFVFVNGPVFTADAARSFARAVAVEDGVITTLGAESEVTSLIGAGTQVVDLAGRLLTPGFQDAHVHPGNSGLDLLECSFSGCSNAGDAIAFVAQYAAANPSLEWIRGAGWQQTWFPGGRPAKELLDAVVPDRPVLVYNADGHGAWANSRALEIAGVDSTTSDPARGRIERYENGEPQGTLHEGAASLILPHMPDITVDDMRRGILRGQQYMLSKGITTWHDAHVDEMTHQAYRGLAGSGELLGNARGALWWEHNEDREQIERLEDMRLGGLGRYQPVSVKLMLDGVVETNTASMLDPYFDGKGHETDDRGIDFIDRDLLLELVPELDRRGFSCHFHAIGDAAVRNALDAVEAARLANGWSPGRHHICHIQVVAPADIPRFRRLGVAANAQALWAQDGEDQELLTRPFLGSERTGWQYPFASLLRAGATLAMGSDWGVSTADVMDQIDIAVTRCNPDRPELAPLNPDERISFLDGLTAFTAGSAYVNHREDVSGTLAVGMLADLVVLDRDPTAGGPIRDASVAMAMVEGVVAYEEG
jgi:predicted amidohydrolase YtcJ